MNDTRFDYPLVFRTYPGSILLSLASVVNSRNADDGFSERAGVSVFDFICLC